MSSSDFRHIASKSEKGRAERLFRAAVSAYCSLTRPSRREAIQLEHLTLPLFDEVSNEGRRYVAAALSECHPAPVALVERLADQTIDIAAPLLMRSRALSDVELIGVIGRHGLAHARAIARRDDLNPLIARLINLLEAASEADAVRAERLRQPPVSIARPVEAPRPSPADETRQRLRGMMLPAHQDHRLALDPLSGRDVADKLRDTALTGSLAFFQTALADSLGIGFQSARSLTETADPEVLAAVLRALDIPEDRAFLILAAVRPGRFERPEAIRHFLDRYRRTSLQAAAEILRGWKAEAPVAEPRPTRQPADAPSGVRRQKTS